MTGKLTARSADSLAKRKGRWLDGGGLFLRVLNPGHKVYWTYRYRLNGKDRETSVGAFPAMSLALARIRHAELRALVLKGVDPLAKRSVKAAPQRDAELRPMCRQVHRHPRGRLEERQASAAMGDDADQILRADLRSAGRQDRRQGGA